MRDNLPVYEKLGVFYLGRPFDLARRASTAMRSAGRTLQERQDVTQAAETIEALNQQVVALNAELEAEVAGLQVRLDPQKEALETLSLKPRKKDVETKLLTLAWAPEQGGEAAW